MMKRHPDSYVMRNWNSLRSGIKYYPTIKKATKDSYFLAKEYDAVSIEYGHSNQKYYMSPLSIIFWNPVFKHLWTPSVLFRFLQDRGLAYWPEAHKEYIQKKKNK